MTDHADDAVAASGQSANGSAGLKPDDGTLIGKAVVAELAPVLGQVLPQIVNMIPQLVAQGVIQALQQVPVRTRRVCSQCLLTRMNWEGAHRTELEMALEAAVNLTGADRSDPRVLEVAVGLLPPGLQPGSGGAAQMPQVNDAVTIAAGAEVCPVHIPGAPQQGARLLIPPPGMPVSVAVQMLSGGMPGMAA